MDVYYPEEARDADLEGSVILGVTVDTLCQVKDKRIIQDIGMGCGRAALVGVDKDFELGLMKRFDFKCTVGEMLVPVRFEPND
ncbi:MAG: energy transducer TonB [Flavobacteriales bacterium]|nr:MAG: energy transducer TonB [Flavobacteriales bacterium]